MRILSILTYNIAWEVSEGISSKGIKEVCPKNNGITTCIQNIIDMLNDLFADIEFDFVCFQETNKWRVIREKTVLSEYNYFTSISDKEEMVTFWKPEIGNPSVVRGGHFSSGRPFHFLYFEDEELCLMNIHPGHDKDEFIRIEKLLEEDELELIDESNVIIAGDFNQVPEENVKLFSTELNGVHNIQTCCDSSLGTKKRRPFAAYDQILSTGTLMESEVIVTNKYFSDHYPVWNKFNMD